MSDVLFLLVKVVDPVSGGSVVNHAGDTLRIVTECHYETLNIYFFFIRARTYGFKPIYCKFQILLRFLWYPRLMQICLITLGVF